MSIFDQRQPGVTDQRPVTFNPSDLSAQGGTDGGLPSANLHPSASSGGGTSPLGFHPNLTPEQAAAVAQTLGGLIYSLPAGGYGSTLDFNGKPPTEAELSNANSAYNKFGPLNANSDFIKRGIADPAANARAANLYAGLGSLPTANNLTPSAQLLANQTPGYKPELGPSINERLGHPWQGPWAF